MQIDTAGIGLGDRVVDPISNVRGTVVCISQWNSGFTQATVQQVVGPDGKLPELAAFACDQLQLIASAQIDRVTLEVGGVALASLTPDGPAPASSEAPGIGRDAAEVLGWQANSIRALRDAGGFTTSSIVDAVTSGDLGRLKSTAG